MLLTLVVSAALHCAAASCAPEASAADFAARVLAAHNRERMRVCAPPLAWDPKIAAAAGQWAQHLATIGDMVHSGNEDETIDAVSGEGENLFAGTRGAYDVERMIGFWADEKRLLAHLPRWSDDLAAVGHYTQMVWRTTTHVGCAVARGAREDYFVCRYTPPGNVDGEQPFDSARAKSDAAPAAPCTATATASR